MTDDRRREAVCQLERLIDQVLFTPGGWPADPCALGEKMLAIGLEENIPDRPGTSRLTALGASVRADLYSAFLGYHEWYEIPFVLERTHTFSAEESEYLLCQLEEDGEEAVSEWLKAKLQQA